MTVEEAITRRAQSRVPISVLKAIAAPVYVAGNALNRARPRDIDIFPCGSSNDITLSNLSEIADKIVETRNAVTWKMRDTGVIVQLCAYRKPSLKDLVNSFDFAHVQAGVAMTEAGKVTEVYTTAAWKQAKLKETTWYTGSEYPLSSLMRLIKYQERGEFAGKSWMIEVMAIASDIIARGYTGYDDFLDQMDAVDLGLLPQELEDMSGTEPQEVAMRLFDLLRRDSIDLHK